MAIASDSLLWVLYAPAIVLVIGGYLWSKRRAEQRHAAALAAAEASGLTEPPSLHPVVDPVRCVGSGACVRACPEQALGIVGGKAVLTSPAACIGHGACHAACPVQAITLVFGSERRGVDIPSVKPDFETNVRGLYIAGELGGMGLIRKAAEQGRQAVANVARRPRAAHEFDLVIVGAGPAGIAAGLGALEHKLRFALIEQEESLGGAVFHYPRNKVAMTAPVDLPLVGRMHFTEVSKEKLLAFWLGVVQRTRLPIRTGVRMEGLERRAGGFVVRTNQGELRSACVLLAIGRRGTPRKLGVAGEELPKVVYRLVDPEQYAGLRVLVVGGGDSAVEAALACSESAVVTLSYRGDTFGRLKAANRQRLDAAQRERRVRVVLRSEVRTIEPHAVLLDTGGDVETIANDAVIVCAGGVLATELLKAIGVTVETHRGLA